MNPKELQFEKFWRGQLLKEVEELIASVPEVNAQGVVVMMKDKINDL